MCDVFRNSAANPLVCSVLCIIPGNKIDVTERLIVNAGASTVALSGKKKTLRIKHYISNIKNNFEKSFFCPYFAPAMLTHHIKKKSNINIASISRNTM